MGFSDSMVWYRRARVVALVILAAVTIWGIREAASGDWESIAGFWRAKLPYLPLVLGLALLDVALEGVGWIWIYERFGLRAANTSGAKVFLSGNAGRLMPAQLGRLIRPDGMVRLGRGTPAQCAKAEGTAFVLDTLSVAALLAGVGVALFRPLLAPFAALGLIAACLFLGDRVADRLTGTRFDLPRGFWWNWKTFAIVIVEMGGWTAHGVAFYVLVADLPGNVGVLDALFFAPASAVLGVGTGLPGGIGATEGFLGSYLRFSKVPAEHLALVVGAFRVVTFWVWLPIGWVALALTRRKAARLDIARAGSASIAPDEPAAALGAAPSDGGA